MITMEFEEMKKIWDAQNKETLYAINEDALYNRILSKKRTTNKITNYSEFLLIGANLGSAVFIAMINSLTKASMILYAISVWMIATALYVIIGRIQRLSGAKKIGETMLEELNLAIATATYQVRLSQVMRWNALPVGGLIVMGVWSKDNSIWFPALVGIVFILCFYASGWEHRIYKSRKNELEMLRTKLDSEN